MSKFSVGDKVRIKDYMDPNGAMCGMMLEQREGLYHQQGGHGNRFRRNSY